MGLKTRCPKCSAVNVVEVDEDGVARCPDCRKAFRPQAAKPAAPPPMKTRGEKRTVDERDRDDDAEEATRRRKKGKKRKTQNSRSKMWIAVGVGGGLVTVGVLITVLLLMQGGGSGGGGPKGGGPDKGGAKGAVIEAPLPDVVAVVPPKVEYKIAAAEKPQWVSLSSNAPAPLWKIAPDAPADPPVMPAADLDITIPFTPANEIVPPPVFAGLRGPFVVPGAQWKEKAYDEERDKRGVLVPKERPQPPAPVIDIRTGKSVGTFSWKANPGKPGTFLSPDGKYLVSPDPIASFAGTRTDREGTLYVWAHGKDEATQLQLNGSVRWMGFIGPTQLAALSFTPTPQFSVWDVATAKLERSTPLPGEWFDKPLHRGGDRDFKYPYYPQDNFGAVSPTGKYVAFVTLKGIALLTSADGKEAGIIPIGDGTERFQFRSLSFSPDGASVQALVSHSFPRIYTTREAPGRSWPRQPQKINKGVQGSGAPTLLKRWDVATGQMNLERAFHSAVNVDFPNMRGNVYPGPTQDIFLFGSASEGEGPVGRVLETVAGTTVDKLDFEPVYVGGDNHLVGVFKVDAKKHTLRVVRYDEKALLERNGAKLAGIAGRPIPRKLDRGGAAVGPPKAPAEWMPPPGAVAAETPGEVATTASVPVVFADNSAAELRPVPRDEKLPREELHWQPLDPKTGQPVGKAVLLYPWTYPPRDLPAQMKPHDIPPAALSGDGKRIGVIDPAQANRVDAWDPEGKHLGAIVPSDEYGVDWIGWSAAGKLLTLCHGKFAAWDVATGKASYEVDGGYPGPITLAPGRGWIAVCGTEAVDLIDAETGRCLGRCQPKSAGGGFQAVSIAADGKYLAAARPVVLPPDPKIPAKGAPALWATSQMADIWDLATGVPVEIPFGAGPLQFLQWRSQRLLFAGTGQMSSRLELLDPAAASIVASFTPPKASKSLASNILAASPDGRVWFNIRNPHPGEAAKTPAVWHAPSLFGVDMKTAILVNPERKYADLRKEAIRVEVDLDEKSRSTKVAERLAGDLQRDGFKIGPGNFVLRVKFTPRDSGAFLRSDRGAQINIPEVLFQTQLLDESGGVVWEATRVGQFAFGKSRYYIPAKIDKEFGRDRDAEAQARMYNFASGGADAHKAIVEEILDNWASTPEVTLPPGGMLVRAGGTSRLLPIQEEARLP